MLTAGVIAARRKLNAIDMAGLVRQGRACRASSDIARQAEQGTACFGEDRRRLDTAGWTWQGSSRPALAGEVLQGRERPGRDRHGRHGHTVARQGSPRRRQAGSVRQGLICSGKTRQAWTG